MTTSGLNDLGLTHGTDKASDGHDYLGTYQREIERVFGPMYQSHGSLLELGLWQGASARMWRDALPHWHIAVVDNDPQCVVPEVDIFRNDQTDGPRLDRIAEHMGGFDVVVDDASHISPLTVKSFSLLWPHVKPGGLYFVEDLQVSYHPDWQQHGHTTSMEFLKRLADAAHYGHANAGPEKTWSDDIAHVAFWPGLCMVEKTT